MTSTAGPPGLQAQRTALAWGRTAFALVVTTLLVLRAGIRSGDAATQVLAGAVAVASGGFLVVSVLRRLQLQASTAAAPAPWMLLAVAAAVSLSGVTAAGAFLLAVI